MYLFLDTELGGIGREYSLLTAYFITLDDNFNKINDLYLYLKPNDNIYKVCGEAMEINKIDLVKHDKVAITYKVGGTKLYDFLNDLTNNGAEKLIVCGHGVFGDVNVIIENLINRGSFEKFTSYRKLDTSVVTQFLKSCNKFPETVSGSLSSLAEHFGIIKPSEDGTISFVGLLDYVVGMHDAKTDTLVSVEVFKKLRNMITNEKV